MLDLNSPEWAHVRSSGGGDGRLTAQLLGDLYAGEEQAWAELYNQVCHQSTVGEVAYIAVPHMVQIAEHAGMRLRAQLLFTIGAIEASRQTFPSDTPTVPHEWHAEYDHACSHARALAAQSLRGRGDPTNTIALIGALAGLHGHANLALLLQSGPEPWCPECGTPIDFTPNR